MLRTWYEPIHAGSVRHQQRTIATPWEAIDLAKSYDATAGVLAQVAARQPEGYFPFTIPRMRLVAGYGMSHPFIAEGGCAQIEIVGFGDMSVADVARECRISLLEARLAKLRDHSECFRLLRPSESARRRLARALEVADLRYMPGEPFDQVSSAKGFCAAVKMLRRLYQQMDSQLVVGIDLAAGHGGQCGLGSGVGMLPAAEHNDIVGWARAISVFVSTQSRAHLPSR